MLLPGGGGGSCKAVIHIAVLWPSPKLAEGKLNFKSGLFSDVRPRGEMLARRLSPQKIVVDLERRQVFFVFTRLNCYEVWLSIQKDRNGVTDTCYIPSSVEGFGRSLLFMDIAAMCLISHIVTNRGGMCFHQTTEQFRVCTFCLLASSDRQIHFGSLSLWARRLCKDIKALKECLR
jgi:hypothetical protein